VRPRLAFKVGVRVDVRRALRVALDKLVKTSPPKHEIIIYVVSEQAIDDGNRVSFGVFGHCGRSEKLAIYVAAGAAEVVQEKGGTRATGVADVVDTLRHEWAHYEQFRDGKKLQERGVAARARGKLAKKRAA
jgi:hypothetical protein